LKHSNFFGSMTLIFCNSDQNMVLVCMLLMLMLSRNAPEVSEMVGWCLPPWSKIV
jgi:hypothetical protein